MDKFRNIYEKAEILRDITSKNLSNLVKTRSMSGGERDVAGVLSDQMRESGFDEVVIDPLGNVIGRIGSGKRILVFDGHIDTVDTGNIDNWDKDPFSGEIDEKFVWGRGSADQKGGVASFVTAGKILKDIGIKNDVSVYFVGSVMEEDCDGLCWKYIIEEDKLKPDLVISTEPTSLNIYRGHRGRMEMEVVFRGVSSHGSAPERGKNAIYMASAISLEIEKLNRRLKKDDFLGKGSITVTEFVSGSPSLCAVADYAKIYIDRRLTWGENEESAVNEIEELIKDFDANVSVPYYSGKSYTGLDFGMKKYFPTWKIDEDHEYIRLGDKVFSGLFGADPILDKWTFSTNGVTINGIYKIPVIGFGPGEEKMAHAPNERIAIDDLVKASAFYAAFASDF